MSSSTRQAVAAAKEIITPLLSDADLKFAEELFAIGSAVADSKQLRNILSDPSAEIAGKKAALAAVFGKSVSSKTVDFVAKHFVHQKFVVLEYISVKSVETSIKINSVEVKSSQSAAAKS